MLIEFFLQELSVYDIQSFDPELGRVLLEFQALIDRKRYLETVCGEKSTFDVDMCFRNTKIEDLYLDFTLPGYPEYVLSSGSDHKMVGLCHGDYLYFSETLIGIQFITYFIVVILI